MFFWSLDSVTGFASCQPAACGQVHFFVAAEYTRAKMGADACVFTVWHLNASIPMKAQLSTLSLGLVSVLAFGNPEPTPKPVSDSKPAADSQPEKVKKSDSEWEKLLSPEQFRVTRTAGTERPFGAGYEEFNAQGEGTYCCVCCGAELFTSKQKFHSGCGWPSFYDQSTAKGVAEHRDPDGHRIETVCKRCDAHLGHVFEGEGYNTPTNRRFCINGVALKFVPASEKKPELKDLDKAKAEATATRKKDAAAEAEALKK
jgi:peptide-methionine (R)-S-oxide reductase